jgi:hypothetical protein
LGRGVVWKRAFLEHHFFKSRPPCSPSPHPPAPPSYDQYADAWDTSITADIDGETVRFFHTVDRGVDRVWVDHDAFLARVRGKTGAKLYGGTAGTDFPDNQARFALLCKAALAAIDLLPFSPASGAPGEWGWRESKTGGGRGREQRGGPRSSSSSAT